MRFRKFLFEMAQKSQGQASGARTELPPVIWWNYNINPESMDKIEMYDYLRDNLHKFKDAFAKNSDLINAQSAFKKKVKDDTKKNYIESSIGFYKFLKSQDSRKKIKKVQWVGTLTVKKTTSRPDIKIIYADGETLGVSLKAGKSMGKRLSSPILNSTINKMMDSILGNWSSLQKEIRDELFKNVYSKIDGITRNDLNDKKNLKPYLKDFKENNSKEYEELWNIARQIIRKYTIKVFNDPVNLESIKNYILKKWFGTDASDVDTMTVYGAKNTWRISYTAEYVNLYIDNVNQIEAKPYQKSGSVNINLISDKIPGKKIILRMDITSAKETKNPYGKLEDIENIALRTKDMIIKK